MDAASTSDVTESVKTDVADTDSDGGSGTVTSSEADATIGGDVVRSGGGEGTSGGGGMSYVPRHSKAEKKARKILSKLDLTPIPGIERVVIRRTDDSMFVIRNPEVFKNPKSNSYIVFGDWMVNDLGPQARSDASQMFKMPELRRSAAPALRPLMKQPMTMYDEVYNEIDYRDVNMKDVKLICDQMQVDTFTAIDSLWRNNHDIVNAIMDLTLT